MLCLTRHKDESIVIDTPNGTIEIMVTRIGSDTVGIGIAAPPSFPIHRKEIAEAIRREQAAAAKPNIVKLQQRGI